MLGTGDNCVSTKSRTRPNRLLTPRALTGARVGRNARLGQVDEHGHQTAMLAFASLSHRIGTVVS